MSEPNDTFFEILEKLADYGSIKTPDFVAITLPLLEAVTLLHQNSQVAFITSIEQISYNNITLSLNSQPGEIIKNAGDIFKKPINKAAVEVSAAISETVDVGVQVVEHKSMDVRVDEAEITRPLYITDYKCWDYECGHYDPLTDIFQLGQIFASIAYNLNFKNRDDIELFVSNRKRLYFLNRDLHPTIHSVIYEMTNLYREDRTKNLDEIITKIKNYREYNPAHYIDLTQTEGFRNQDVSDRNNWILAKLKNRLFDISRRNKLLYFTDRKSFLNLTVSSVPLLLDHENIKEDDLLFWNEKIHKKIIKQQNLPLNSYLEFKENRFLAPALNTIRLEARKSQNEYGFSQMRMVIAFMHWYNFKENAEERISSPLLLLPAEIVKKKGVEDLYTLVFSGTEAEINPVLSHYLKDLYGLELPDFINLETNTIEELLSSIESQIAEGGTGIQLEWRQKPKIQLIHSIARKNHSLKNKKLLNKSRGFNVKNFDYSYTRESFHPLGVQIFNERIRRKNSALEYIINEDLRPQDNLAVAEKPRSFYQTDNDGEVNPLIWEVDTCNITIGNFNYRKMSLVRDYNEIINSNIQDKVFEQLFSELPGKLAIPNETIRLEDNYPIISSDPTQTGAIELARTGESYIIQGPPGTGKSQTITNLIADYIARDKKILFVCEKRAALDVVYHRLKNKNLDELCCLVHDSQMDKKSFIQDLRQVYNDFQKNLLDPKIIEDARNTLVNRISQEIDEIAHFHHSMIEGHTPPLELFTALHASKQGKTIPSEVDCIHFPGFDIWKENCDWITEWLDQLVKNNFSPYIADYPLAQLSVDIIESNNPKATVLEHINNCTDLIDNFTEFLDAFDGDFDNKKLDIWIREFALAEKIINLSHAGKLSVFNPKSELARELQDKQQDILMQKNALSSHEQKNLHWTHKFSAPDTAAAIEQWQGFQANVLRFLIPDYYRLKKKIRASYDFTAHDISPTIDSILANLLAEHKTISDIQTLKKQVALAFYLRDYDSDCRWIAEIQKQPDDILSAWIAADNPDYLQGLMDNKDTFNKLIQMSTALFTSVEELSLVGLDKKLTASKNALNSLSVFLPYINKANKQTPLLKNCLVNKRWDAADFSYNLAYKSLQDAYAINRAFYEADGDSLQVNISRINALLDRYYESNVELIRSKIRQKFLNMIRITESTAAQLTAAEKLLKKTCLSGRRILENEFGKSMRYKSIRELTSGDAKELMTTIKPVWLMSPLSVSDILPIDTSIFDVVIYDEASQITVEEGVPSFFRTHQMIVVGDEMQMPPTNFFSTAVVQDEEEEEAENKIGISLDAESLLNQSSRKLASVMLGWHYRSRHESLISFSNAAFYQRSLLTIPDTATHNNNIQALEPVLDVSLAVNTEHILKRSISFHYLENAVYENRKNRDEADYIANIIRQLLRGDSNKSIGVVAFSMDQQSEIESSLDRLAAEDADFDRLIEEEYQREDEDQFNGLFVKNLENVQGDERDIIIMSVCYGANTKGKVLMNFGPINRRGGEKRLNVIFSRAKEHMVIVSSILANEIKNDYNEGANYFKRFLSYAKYCSDGRNAEANLILDSLYSYDEDLLQISNHCVVQELAGALKKKGYAIDLAVGRSHFKCDIAIKKADSSHYSLGILIDKPAHYDNTNILEQYCQQPDILTAFGWRIATVYSKDWFEKPERVLEKIEQKLAGESDSVDIDLNALMNTQTSPDKETAFDVAAGTSTELTADIGKELAAAKATAPKDIPTAINFDRYEFKNATSNKYWEISAAGSTLYVQYGRIGNKPQCNEKIYQSAEQANTEKEKLVAKKLKKGYFKT